MDNRKYYYFYIMNTVIPIHLSTLQTYNVTISFDPDTGQGFQFSNSLLIISKTRLQFTNATFSIEPQKALIKYNKNFHVFKCYLIINETNNNLKFNQNYNNSCHSQFSCISYNNSTLQQCFSLTDSTSGTTDIAYNIFIRINDHGNFVINTNTVYRQFIFKTFKNYYTM
jgi:hypothetical protein